MGVTSKVSIVHTADRAYGAARAIELTGVNPVKNKNVLIKPNFNTEDPFPASTHPETLRQLILKLRLMGAKNITIGERSGPPDTSDVIRDLQIDRLANELGVDIINFELLPPEGWRKFHHTGLHWKNGFLVAAPVLDSECIVSTCCLKTHRFGGGITMSLKLSVGITHKNNMAELHSNPAHIKEMIAEVNLAYQPSLILMDGLKCFTDGGPEQGVLKEPGLMFASTDRVAIDAVGIAVLKTLGSNRDIMQSKIFKQGQIKHATGILPGIKNSSEIELAADNTEQARHWADKLRTALENG